MSLPGSCLPVATEPKMNAASMAPLLASSANPARSTSAIPAVLPSKLLSSGKTGLASLAEK